MSLRSKDLKELDPLSKAFGRLFLERHPDWAEYAWIETEEGFEEEPPHLVVQLTHPSGDGYVLEISTEGGEVMVSMRFWHTYSSMLVDVEGDTENEALLTLQLTERLWAGNARPWARFKAGEWMGSGLIERTEDPEALAADLADDERLTIVSFDGLGDQTFGNGPAPEDVESEEAGDGEALPLNGPGTDA